MSLAAIVGAEAAASARGAIPAGTLIDDSDNILTDDDGNILTI